MNIRQVIEKADLFQDNAIPEEMKVGWIAELDGLIAAEVMNLAPEELGQFQYSPDTDMDREVLVQFPFDSIYHYWLCARIDAENGEYRKYRNSIQLYNSAFAAFRVFFSQRYDVYGGREAPGHYLSAYGLAVQKGFRGTEESWLASLVGPPGPAGCSAYQIAVAYGFEGSEAQWLESLAGGAAGLPPVTEGDNGKVLKVIDGAWAAADAVSLLVEVDGEVYDLGTIEIEE